MSELFRIVLTSSFTVIGGIFIFSMGQIIVKFFIEPIHEQARCIGEIADALIFYADIYSNPGYPSLGEGPLRRDETVRTLRQYASLLISKTHMVRCYGLFEKLKCVPTRKNIFEASQNLIGLSNSIHSGSPDFNMARRSKIMKALNIKIKMD